MAYEFNGFFARPSVPRPAILPANVEWQDITEPFHGVGLRLPSYCDKDADELPQPVDIQAFARELGIDAVGHWIYLIYFCWGGDIDFVFGLGSCGGVSFGPVEDTNHDTVENSYTGLMERFGVTPAAALQFPPFERDFWSDA